MHVAVAAAALLIDIELEPAAMDDEALVLADVAAEVEEVA